MITGQVTATPEAIVRLQVRGPAGLETQIDAVLDTGFTDYLTLPPSIIRELRLPYLDTTECQLADGRIVSMEGFEAVIDWHGTAREILALAAEGDPLLGMSMLYGSHITLDVIDDGGLTIEPLD